MEQQVIKLIEAALTDLDFIYVSYITKLIDRGWEADQIIEALKFLGYGWC